VLTNPEVFVKKVVAAVVFSVAFSACGHRIENLAQTQVSKEGLVAVSANWLKDKGSKYDFQLAVMNNSGKPIIVYLWDIACFRGTVQGEVKHTFFNTGERTIDFKIGEKKAFNMVCRLGGETKGDFRVLIKKIYENPAQDGKTVGQLLGSDVEWKLAETAAK
jgi:hypothetical protein